MKTAIRVGGKVTKKSAKAVADAIVAVFESGHENHMDQETIRFALSQMPSANVHNVSINNCNISQEK